MLEAPAAHTAQGKEGRHTLSAVKFGKHCPPLELAFSRFDSLFSHHRSDDAPSRQNNLTNLTPRFLILSDFLFLCVAELEPPTVYQYRLDRCCTVLTAINLSVSLCFRSSLWCFPSQSRSSTAREPNRHHFTDHESTPDGCVKIHLAINSFLR